MKSFNGEIQRVARRLARAPMFTVVTLLTLAIGIGANTAIFSVINGVLLKPLPFDEPDRLVGVWHTAPGLGIKMLNASPSSYFTYSEENHVFDGLGNYNGNTVTVTGLAEPERVDALFVTYTVLPVLRAQPVIGRGFTAQEDTPAGPETAILTYPYWQTRFGGDRNVIGKRVLVDGKAREIIGVMGQGFRFLNETPSMLLPMRYNRQEVFVGNFSYECVARLKPGVTIEQASADVARMLPLMATKFRMPPGFTLKMMNDVKIAPNLHPFLEDAVGDVGKVLWVLMGTVGIVLFIACANVANLFLVRAEGRQQELAIRAALGAGWGRIARELLTESIALALAGGVLGLGLAYAGIQLLVALEPRGIPRLNEITISGTVLLFTALISLLAGVLFGLIPVFKYAGGQLGISLREGGRNASDGKNRHRARGILVVVQVALALVLLISSGLMIRTFQAMRAVPPGFINGKEVLTMRISIPEAQVKSGEQAIRMHEQILHRIEQIPGVKSVSLATSVPLDGESSNDPAFVEEFPPPEGQIPALRRYKWVSPGHFKNLGNPLIAGRDLTWDDIYQKRPVVMVSENFAREYWKDPKLAVGKRLRETPKNPWREIIAVVGDARDNGVSEKAPTMLYWPLLMSSFWDMPEVAQRSLRYVIRSPRAGAESFTKEVRDAVWSVNSNFPLANIRTLARIHERSMARTSFTLVMLAIASAMALLLGVVGIYGVIAYAVAQRTREIGIRMALGAQQQDVRTMFVKQGLILAGIGVLVGVVAAAAATRLLASLLFGVSPMDPVTFVGVAVTLAGAALLASYLPARRATAIDPVLALRSE